jgi:hypothetical protein
MSTTRLTSKRQLSTLFQSSSGSKILAEGTPLPIALERIFLDAGLKPTKYIQFRGVGSPSVNLGTPGDIFVDLSPKAYRVFVRYETWREWPGLYRDVGAGSDPPGFQFKHPADSTRIIWCNATDVMWYKNSSIRHGRKCLFAAYPNTLFVSAHQLINGSAISRDGMKIGQTRWSSSDNSTLNAESFKKRKVEKDIGSVLSDGRADGNEIPLPPTSSQRSQSVEGEVHNHQTQTVANSALYTGNSSSNITTVSPLVQRQEIQTRTNCIPSSSMVSPTGSPISSDGEYNEYAAVITHQRWFQSHDGSTILYMQFRGYGSPPAELGKPGDMFLDMSLMTYRLFVKYAAWREWPGAYSRPTNDLFLHPDDKTRVVWCSHNDISWYKTVSLSSARSRLFRSISVPFIPAHRMIMRSGILRQTVGAETTNLDNHRIACAREKEGGGASDSREASAGSQRYDDTGSTNNRSASTSHATTIVQAPMRDASSSKSNTLGSDDDKNPPNFSPSRLSSVLSSIPPLETHTPPAVSPMPKSSFDGELREAEVVVAKPDNEASETDEADVARKNQRMQDHYMKRKEKYVKRKDELLQKVAELSKYEEMTTSEEKRARKRLEDARRDALWRQDQIRQQEEELNREKEEIANIEKKVFRREQALKQQREVIKRLEETIVQWESV